MSDNLLTALTKEIERNAKLVQIYKSIGVPGMIGATLIQADIDAAQKAIAEMDTVEMIRVFKALQENEA